MGGTDQMDQAINTYSIKIRLKKWYWQLIAFCIEVSVCNAWLIRTNLCSDVAMSHLKFIRSIAKTYLATYNSERASTGKKPILLYKTSRVARRVEDSVRFDKLNHGIVDAPSRLRCAFCSSQTTKYCLKCKANVHSKCFNAFHGIS